MKIEIEDALMRNLRSMAESCMETRQRTKDGTLSTGKLSRDLKREIEHQVGSPASYSTEMAITTIISLSGAFGSRC